VCGVPVSQGDVTAPCGGTLHAYDTGSGDGDDGHGLVVVWHHGTPNVGAPPAPLFAASQRLGIRWVSYDRPGYGGSTPRPGRDVASAAADVAAVADALGVGTFAVMGHSGGGPHALACAALLPGRVTAAVTLSGPAPYGAPGLDWFAGMGESSAASLRAAVAGRAAKERHEAAATDGDPAFVAADWAALEGEWSWFGSVVAPAIAAGPAALVDDDLAYVAPWGFDLARVSVPVLVGHGTADRMVPSSHAEWLAAHLPAAELRLSPGDGHISVLAHAPAALEWLMGVARPR
jgi:pimeloyl-ACP methyl ester carboxylesterase